MPDARVPGQEMEHLFSLEEAIAIYLIARKLVVELEQL